MDHHSAATISTSSLRRWVWSTLELPHMQMRKVLKTPIVENQDWRTALNAFIKSYWGTLHSTTGQPPAFLLFNRRLYHTKLPHDEHQAPPVKEKELWNTDWTRKQRSKEVVNRKQHAKPRPLVPGDKVFLKQQPMNKTTPRYDPEYYTYTKVTGLRIIATKDNRKVITQHKVFLKRLWQAEKRDIRPTPTSKLDIKISSGSKEEGDNMSDCEGNEEEPRIPTYTHILPNIHFPSCKPIPSN